jgi:hypothetical protein
MHTIDNTRIQRLKDEAARQLNAGERYMLVNPALIIALCDLAKKITRAKTTCPWCGSAVSWADQVATCLNKECTWRGPYPAMTFNGETR